MAQTAHVDKAFIADLVAKTRFNEALLTKDYYLTRLLYLIKDVPGLYFKGGTALQKIFLDYSRISEDIDFTLTGNVKEKEVEIIRLLEKQEFIRSISKDKDVDKFLRIIIHYKDFRGEDETIFIDLNERAKLLTKPETHTISHYYPDMPTFAINTLSKEEMIAEKIAAAIGRNKPRDHYDIYQIIQKKLPINLDLASEKCKQAGCDFDIVRMFNKAKTLKNRWEQDMKPLLASNTSFEEVMTALAKHFKLKEAKEEKRLKG